MTSLRYFEFFPTIMKVTWLFYIVMIVITIAVCFSFYRKRKEGDTHINAFKRWGFIPIAMTLFYALSDILCNIFAIGWMMAVATPVYLIICMSISMIALSWTAFRSKNRI